MTSGNAIRTWSMVLAHAILLDGDAVASKSPAKAVFDVRMPQNDPAQKVKNLEINATYPHQIEKDAEGNRFIYLEANAPIPKELVVLATFTLELAPKQDIGPVNAMAKAWVEDDGKPLPEKEGWVRKLTFRQRQAE